MHTLIYSDDPAATRAWFRDVLKWPYVSDGDGSGGPGGSADDSADWLIFRSGRSEVGVHPTSGADEGDASKLPDNPRHQLSLICDDLTSTLSDLGARGAQFRGEPEDRGYGICVEVSVPGSDDIQIYEPRHRVAYGL